MRRILYIVMLLVLGVWNNAYPQMMKQWGWQPIDTTTLVCQYKYIHPGGLGYAIETETMILEIGSQLTKFYSFDTFAYDSLQSTPQGRLQIKQQVQEVFRNSKKEKTKEGKWRALMAMPSKKSMFRIYKNYPKEKEMLVQDAISHDYVQYIEQDFSTSQSWEIEQDTMTLIGYSCQKASCKWRGRKYTAWFAPEIPISDGPYKFCGLPGLIMKIEDSKGIYSFEIESIRKDENREIFLAKPEQGTYPEAERKQVIERQVKQEKTIVRATNRDMQRIGSSGRVTDEHIDMLEKDY